MKRKILAGLMVLCMLLGLSGVGVYAADEPQWEVVNTMMPVNVMPDAITVGDKIFVAGFGSTSKSTNEFYSFDPVYNTWERKASISDNVYGTKLEYANGIIYRIGGVAHAPTHRTVNTLESYDPATNTWTKKAPMPNGLSNIGTAIVDGKIYVAGGGRIDSKGSENVKSLYVYNIQTNIWEKKSDLPVELGSFGHMVFYEKELYVFASSDNDNIYKYNIEADAWSTYGKIPKELSSAKHILYGDKVYAVGGKVTYEYSFSTKQWVQKRDLNFNRPSCAITVHNGKIYAMGGGATGNYYNTVESIQVIPTTPAQLAVLLNIDETVQLSVTHNLADNSPLTWSSTDQAVATVDGNGKVTAVGEGLAYIYTEDDDGTFKEFIPVRVYQSAAPRLAVHLTGNEQKRLWLSNDTDNASWSSLDTSVATVTDDGVVAGVSKGLAIVQGEIDGDAYQIYIRVNG